MSALSMAPGVQPLLAFAWGCALALMPWADDVGQWWALRAELSAPGGVGVGAEPFPASSTGPHSGGSTVHPGAADGLRGAASAAASGAASPAPSSAGPEAAAATGLAWLPVLQAHGLQLQTLQHPATGPGGQRPLLSLTAQGRWQDWLAMESQKPAPLSDWVPLSWQVQALGPPAAPGQVQLQWLLQGSGARAGSGAQPAPGQNGDSVAFAAKTAKPAAPTLPAPELAPEASARTEGDVQARGGMPSEVFVMAPTQAQAQAQAAASPNATRAREPATPTAWRLLGVWQQDGVAHAVTQQGEQWHRLRPGQRLGPGAERVQRIEADQVWLGEGQATRAVRLGPLGTAP